LIVRPSAKHAQHDVRRHVPTASVRVAARRSRRSGRPCGFARCGAGSPVTEPRHEGHKAMTKPKFKPRGMVRPDTVFHLCSRFDGEWYAIITAKSDGSGSLAILAAIRRASGRMYVSVGLS